jgi:uncharacterized membrane protein
MSRLIPVGRAFFGLALVGLGIEHFLFGDFVTGRAPPWPESLPGGRIWAFATGAGVLVAGVAILRGRHARPAALATGVLVVLWAFLRQLPIAAGDALFASTWTHAGKALTLFGGALAIAGTLPAAREAPGGVTESATAGAFLLLGRSCLGLFLLLTGIQHFIFTEFVASLIPVWFPGDPVFWTRFAGVALISGGLGLLVPPTAPLAALLSGAMVFSWFWIVHLPRTLTSVSDGIAIFEALAVSGIALVLAGALWRRRTGAPAPDSALSAASR